MTCIKNGATHRIQADITYVRNLLAENTLLLLGRQRTMEWHEPDVALTELIAHVTCRMSIHQTLC